MKSALTATEDRVLCLMSNAQGNILDDEELINTLSASKATSVEMAAKVEEMARTEAEIDATREQYRPVAEHAAVLFFAIADLTLVDPMYQYSLAWFITLFERCIEHSDHALKVTARLQDLVGVITHTLYLQVGICLSIPLLCDTDGVCLIGVW